MKPGIFISYSHKDKAWEERLLVHLRAMSLPLEIWDDRRIGVGDDWRAQIKSALDAANVAILLISADFLASEFIRSQEVPRLLERRERANLSIIPVIVEPCAWRHVPWLAGLQARPRGGRPLAALPRHEAESALAEIAASVVDMATYTLAARLRSVNASPLRESHIRLTDIRRLGRMELSIHDRSPHPRSCTVFLGKNGTCKTTLLRALALGLCDEADANALLNEPNGLLLRQGATSCVVALELGAVDDSSLSFPIEQHIEVARGKEVAVVPRTSALLPRPPFVCGYGAGRFGSGEELPAEHRTRDSVATLFNYSRPLHGVELSLRRIRDFFDSDPQRYDSTLAGLRRVLTLDDATIDWPDGGGVRMARPGTREAIPIEGWADGHRLTFTWLLDLYAWAFKAKRIAVDGHIDGILLIDEPEQHLHPSMQAAILPRLKSLLPRMQLFVTTHSPLVALGAEPGELVVLREQGEQVVAEQPSVDFSGYSAEDMLADEQLFDTIPYAPATARKLERYRALVTTPVDARTPDESAQLSALARDLRARQLPEVRGGEAVRELRALLEKHGL